MSTKVIDQTNTEHMGDPQFQFAMLMGQRTVLASTRTELVAELIDGYDELGRAAETAWARYATTLALADQLAELMLGAAIQDGMDPRSVTEDEVNLIVPPDRASTPPFEGHWDGQVPLVLIRSDYSPHTRRVLPTGNVHFLDPTNESTFLDSLAGAGLIELHVRGD